MARNDIHCPSNFQPQDYTLEDYFGEIDMPNMDRQDHEGHTVSEVYGDDAMRFYDNSNPQNNPHPDLYQCDLCGQRFVHGAVLTHKDGDVISVGGICMSGIAGVASLSQGDKLYRAKRELRRRERVANLRAMLADHPGINRALKVDHYISKDLRARAIEWGTLSDKQIDLAFKIEKDEANKAPETPTGPVPVTEERIRITGTVLGLKEVEGYMGGYDLKMVFAMDRGDGTICKLWGKALASKGDTVSFMARVEPSNDDPTFGFFKRPTKIEVTECE